MREKYPVVEHPVVIRHPISGNRLLYVNRFFTTRIVGLDPAESDALLVTLFAQANILEYHCRLHWHPNSIAMWGQPRRAALRIERLLARHPSDGAGQHRGRATVVLNEMPWPDIWPRWELDGVGGPVVVIDVIRAFTTAAYAFGAGAAEIYLVGDVQEALAFKGGAPGDDRAR